MSPKVIVLNNSELVFLILGTRIQVMRIITTLIIAVLGTGIGLNGQLQINELNAVNTSGMVNPVLGHPGDWIEIYNGSASSIDMGGYYLSDNPDTPLKWKFPQDVVVSAGGFLLVWADDTNDTLSGCHANFKLNVGGETLLLHSASGGSAEQTALPLLIVPEYRSRLHNDPSLCPRGRDRRPLTEHLRSAGSGVAPAGIANQHKTENLPAHSARNASTGSKRAARDAG